MAFRQAPDAAGTVTDLQARRKIAQTAAGMEVSGQLTAVLDPRMYNHYVTTHDSHLFRLWPIVSAFALSII